MVPVVYGADDVHKVAPPHSYIDVRDFKSPKHLAEYLLYLDKNDEEYISYFHWKIYYKVSMAHRDKDTLCEVCRYLTEDNRPRIVHDVNHWLFKESKAKPLPAWT